MRFCTYGARSSVAVPSSAAMALNGGGGVGLGVGGTNGPSVEDAVALALARPTAPAPARDPNAGQLTTAQEGGIQFPNYSWSWKGERS